MPYRPMKRILPLFIIVFASCYGTRTVNQVARKNSLTVEEVGGINLFDGHQNIDTRIFDKSRSIYLFYKNDSLKFLSTEKTISNGDYMYRLETVGDSLYMLTRRSQFRYWYEDTVLFHSDYVVSNHCVFQNDSPGYRLRSRTPVISIHQYGWDEKATAQFLNNESIYRSTMKVEMRDFVSQALR